MAPRRKAEKLPAAQSAAEAIAMLGRYAQLQASIDARRAQSEAKIAEIRAAVDAAIAPDEAEVKALFKQVQPWWTVNAEEFTQGKRKSIELGGCLIGHRTTTPKLKLAEITEGEAIESLKERKLDAFLRVTEELDKQAIIKALAAGDDGAMKLAELGFQVSQKDQFFIAPIPPVEPKVEIIPAPASEVAA